MRFQPTNDPAVLRGILRKMVAVVGEAVEANPQDAAGRLELARGLFHLEDFAGAARQYEALANRRSDQFAIWQNQPMCYERTGEISRAAAATIRALELAWKKGDQTLIARLEKRLARYSRRGKGSGR